MTCLNSQWTRLNMYSTMADAIRLSTTLIVHDIRALVHISSPSRSRLTGWSLSLVIFLEVYSQMFATSYCLIYTIRLNMASSFGLLLAFLCSLVYRSRAISHRKRRELKDPMKLIRPLRLFISIILTTLNWLMVILITQSSFLSTPILFYHVWRSWRLTTNGCSLSQRISVAITLVATVSTSNVWSSCNRLCTRKTCACIFLAVDKASLCSAFEINVEIKYQRLTSLAISDLRMSIEPILSFLPSTPCPRHLKIIKSQLLAVKKREFLNGLLSRYIRGRNRRVD